MRGCVFLAGSCFFSFVFFEMLVGKFQLFIRLNKIKSTLFRFVEFGKLLFCLIPSETGCSFNLIGNFVLFFAFWALLLSGVLGLMHGFGGIRHRCGILVSSVGSL